MSETKKLIEKVKRNLNCSATDAVADALMDIHGRVAAIEFLDWPQKWSDVLARLDALEARVAALEPRAAEEPRFRVGDRVRVRCKRHPPGVRCLRDLDGAECEVIEIDHRSAEVRAPDGGSASVALDEMEPAPPAPAAAETGEAALVEKLRAELAAASRGNERLASELESVRREQTNLCAKQHRLRLDLAAATKRAETAEAERLRLGLALAQLLNVATSDDPMNATLSLEGAVPLALHDAILQLHAKGDAALRDLAALRANDVVPKADIYDRIREALGVESDALGAIRALQADLAALRARRVPKTRRPTIEDAGKVYDAWLGAHRLDAREEILSALRAANVRIRVEGTKGEATR